MPFRGALLIAVLVLIFVFLNRNAVYDWLHKEDIIDADYEEEDKEKTDESEENH